VLRAGRREDAIGVAGRQVVDGLLARARAAAARIRARVRRVAGVALAAVGVLSASSRNCCRTSAIWVFWSSV
jgi:hypothetical protein